MFCSSCGSGLSPNSGFCSRCGAKQEVVHPQGGPPGSGHPNSAQGGWPPQDGQPGSSYSQGGWGPHSGPSGSGYPQGGWGPQSGPPGSGYPHAGAPVAPGKTLLRVVGILLVVFGIIGALVAFGGLATADYWDSVLPIDGASWTAYYLVALLSAAFSVVIGIVAIINCARPEKAGLCKFLAIISIIGIALVHLFSFGIGAYAALGFGGLAVITMLRDFLLPILIFIGASRNQRASMPPRPY